MQASPTATGSAAPAASPATLPEGQEEQGALSLDALLGILRRFWPLVLLFALLGGGAAYYIAGCQNYLYSKSASVMLRTDKAGAAESISASILGDLGMDTGAANLANESYILKSTALMQNVVETLGLDTAYWKRQQFREVDLYGQSPVLARFGNMDPNRSCTLTVWPLDEARYRLGYEGSDGQPEELEAGYGETVGLPFGTLMVQPTSRMGAEWIGIPITIRRQPVLATAQGLLAALTVTRPDLKEASMLELTLTATHPRKAEDVLNQLIEAYNQRSKDEKSEAARKTRAFIQGRLADLGRDLNEDDARLKDARRENELSSGVESAESAINADLSATQELDKQIFEMQMQVKLAGTLASDLASHKEGLISLDTGIADNSFSSKIEAYNEAWLGYNRIAQSAGERNPLVVEKRDTMAATLRAARKALQNYRSNTELKLQEVQEKRKAHQQRLEAMAERKQELAPLIREHKVKEELYMLLLTKEQENALALAIAEPSARVLESAHGPDAPVSPRTAVFIAAGAGGGAALCVLCIIGLGMLNNKVRNKYDVAGYSSLPVLAELPELTRRERNRNGLVNKDSHSTMAECLHILRNNADNMLPRPEKGGHTILITSSMSGEGKSYISANLAATYAQAGRRVLLVDGDLRKASLTRALGGKGRHGLTSLLLRHESEPAAIIRPLTPATGQDGTGTEPPAAAASHGGQADILYAGPTVPNPITLLAQPLLAELLHDLQLQYDAVIIDAPPTGILADTDILAAAADISLYVIRAGFIDKRYLAQVQKLADSGKLPHAAYIINAVDFRTSSYSHYGYGYGYYRYGYSGSNGK